MTRGRAARVAALVCVAALAGACEAGQEGTDRSAADSSAIADTAPAAALDACTLVDEAAVADAVGFDVVMNGNDTGNCLVTPASGDPAAPAFDFRVEPRVAPFDYFSAQPDATPIDSLGDRAVWATLNDMTGHVVVVVDGRSIVVAVAKADGLDAGSRRRAERLAALLLARAGPGEP